MKTFVGNLLAVSTLTAFIATSIPSVSAVALSPGPHVVRHLNHAHIAKVKRNLHKRSCTPRPAPAADPANDTTDGGNTDSSGGNTDNSGGSTDNSGGSTGNTDNSGGSTDNSGGNTDTSGSTDNGGDTYNNGGSTDNSGGSTTDTGGSTDNSGGSTTDNGGSTSSGGSSSGSTTTGDSSGGSASSPLFSHKKGLAFPNGCDQLTQWTPQNLGWHYNWRATPYGDCPSGMPPYIPMVWGWNQIGDFNNAVSANQPEIVFFLNEPDLCNDSGLSSCVSPPDACTIWWQTVGNLQSRGVKVGSSGTTSAPAGLQWEKDFRSYCNVKPDFITAHYYGTSWEDFITYATGWYNAFGQGIVFTEVGCQDFNNGPQCSYDQITTFIQQITHWCLTTDWCWGITFFGAMLDMVNVNTMDQLMNTDYSPNAMGWTFLNGS